MVELIKSVIEMFHFQIVLDVRTECIQVWD